jgi:hypothetical protein
MIFTDVIHDEFKKLITEGSNESEPLWTVEKGFKDPQGKFPKRAFRGYADTFYPALDHIDKENVCAFKAFKVFIHKPNEIITSLHEYNILNYDEFMKIVLLPVSHKTDKALKGFPPEIRKCYFEGEKTLKYFKTYTKTNCEFECHANETLERCGCARYSHPREQNTKVCNVDEAGCPLVMNLINCSCLPACDDLKYNYKIEKTHFNKDMVGSGMDERLLSFF